MRWCTTIDKYDNEVWILACIARCSWAACAFNRGSPRHALIHVISHVFSTCTCFRTETQDSSGTKIATNLGLLFSQLWPNKLHCIVPGLCRKGCPTLNTFVQLNLVIGFTACCYVCKYIVYIAHILHTAQGLEGSPAHLCIVHCARSVQAGLSHVEHGCICWRLVLL